MLLILSSTAAPTCYSLNSNFSQADLNSRYINLGMFSPCSDVGEKRYVDALMDYWLAANQSYTLELAFRGAIQRVADDREAMEAQVRVSLQRISDYSSALVSAQTHIEYLFSLIDPYGANLHCGSLRTLTENLYQSFCGELLPNSFLITLMGGGLGTALIGLTLAVMMAYFWFRSTLEIDREQVMRNVAKGGRMQEKDTKEKGESLFEAASERTIMESEVVEASAPPLKPGLEAFKISKFKPKPEGKRTIDEVLQATLQSFP